jgi:hypothetical protein
MVIIEPSPLGGTEHCQKDNLHLAHEHTLNWLCSLGLAPTPPAISAVPKAVQS